MNLDLRECSKINLFRGCNTRNCSRLVVMKYASHVTEITEINLIIWGLEVEVWTVYSSTQDHQCCTDLRTVFCNVFLLPLQIPTSSYLFNTNYSFHQSILSFPSNISRQNSLWPKSCSKPVLVLVAVPPTICRHLTKWLNYCRILTPLG